MADKPTPPQPAPPKPQPVGPSPLWPETRGTEPPVRPAAHIPRAR